MPGAFDEKPEAMNSTALSASQWRFCSTKAPRPRRMSAATLMEDVIELSEVLVSFASSTVHGRGPGPPIFGGFEPPA
jgi:hypothetical protein